MDRGLWASTQRNRKLQDRWRRSILPLLDIFQTVSFYPFTNIHVYMYVYAGHAGLPPPLTEKIPPATHKHATCTALQKSPTHTAASRPAPDTDGDDSPWHCVSAWWSCCGHDSTRALRLSRGLAPMAWPPCMMNGRAVRVSPLHKTSCMHAC
jgi:hypothetical protein